MRIVLSAVSALLFLAPAASAEGVPSSCPGDPINVSQVITGTFDTSRQGSYVLVPFDVPAGTTSVRVKYCYDQPQAPRNAQLKHTLDLGLYEPGGFGERQFRGWGGSSHPDVTVTPQGFSTEAEYRARPKGHVPGRTTRGFIPGPIPAGQWNAELGVAAVVSQADGDADGRVAWRVEVERSSIPTFAADNYEPARYDARPAKRAGWYEGDLHVHGEHSALGDAPMSEVFDYGFKTAGLDFITLTDYVTTSAWGEVGRYQPRYPGKLIARSSEVITYRGHFMNHVSGQYVDYRTGPVLRFGPGGALTQVRGAEPPRDRFAAIRRRGGFTQINHPTIFPSDQPGNANICRGCPWDYSDSETNFRAVDAWEVNTGPAAFGGTVPNPFTATALTEWDELRERNLRLTGVGVSDSHDAGSPDGPTESPVGNGRTVVRADELSEDGVRRAIQAGHAYVKTFRTSPDIRFTGTARGRLADMGDALPGRRATLRTLVSRVPDEDGWRLIVVRDGRRGAVRTLRPGTNVMRIKARRGEYRLQIERGGVVHTVTNPIAVGDRPRPIPAGIRAGNRRAALKLRALRVKRRGTTARVTFRVRSNGGAPLTGVRVRSGRARGITDSRGRVTLTLRHKMGRHRATATGPRWRTARTSFRVR